MCTLFSLLVLQQQVKQRKEVFISWPRLQGSSGCTVTCCMCVGKTALLLLLLHTLRRFLTTENIATAWAGMLTVMPPPSSEMFQHPTCTRDVLLSFFRLLIMAQVPDSGWLTKGIKIELIPWGRLYHQIKEHTSGILKMQSNCLYLSDLKLRHRGTMMLINQDNASQKR